MGLKSGVNAFFVYRVMLNSGRAQFSFFVKEILISHEKQQWATEVFAGRLLVQSGDVSAKCIK